MFIINKNSGFFSRHEISFKKLASGQLLHEYNVLSTSLKYETSFDHFRAFLEIIIVIITSWYVYRIVKSLLLILVEIERFQMNSQSDDLKKNKTIFVFLRFDKNKYFVKSTCSGLLKLLLKIFTSFVRLLYNLVVAIYQYSKISIFNVIDMVSITIIMICMTIWIEIITTDIFVLDFQGNSDSAFNTIDNTINLLSYYEGLVSFNILLMCLNIMQYFSFSSKLSMFYEVIRSSFFDIVFFGFMQTIIMCGYALIGFMLFGISDEGFSTYQDSIFTVFMIFVGDKSVLEISTSKLAVLYIFGVSFKLMSLMLLNMLIAIYTSHYFQFYCDNNLIKTNTFYLFLRILGGKRKIDRKPNFISKLVFKIRSCFNFLADSISNSTNEEDTTDIPTLNYDNLKQFHHNHLLTAPKDIINLVLENISENKDSRMTGNCVSAKTETSKIYFWTCTLNSQLKIVLKSNFKSYCSIFNLVTDCREFEGNKMDKDSDIFNDDEIKFLMSSDNKKIELWNKADFHSCRRYWKVIECNKDLYREASESHHNYGQSRSKFYSRNSNLHEERKAKLEDNSSKSELLKHKIVPINQSFNSDRVSSDESESEFDDQSNSIEDFHCINIQKEIWIQTLDYSKLFYLWTECFTVEQMNGLWNSLEFPFEYFQKLKKNKLISEGLREEIEKIEKKEVDYNFKHITNKMKNKDLNLFIESIICNKYDGQEDINAKLDERYFNKLMKERSAINDVKTPLWIILTLKQKILLCSFQSSDFEIKIMTLMILKEMRMGIKKLRIIDKELEGTVTNLIYDLYFKISEEKAIRAKQLQVNSRFKIFDQESKEMIEYIEFLGTNMDKISNYKHHIVNKAIMDYRDSSLYKKRKRDNS